MISNHFNFSIPHKYRWMKKVTQPPAEDGGEPVVTEVQTEVPGCWTPATFLSKGAACKFLFPLRAEKVINF